MARFVVRRLAGMVFVLFAVSVLTFLIFNVIPNSDPAVRMAGRQANANTIQAIREEWGFDESLPEQYVTTMEKIFTGDLISQFTQLDVLDEIWKGLPRTMSLAVGAALMWMFFALALGLYSAVRAGKFADRFLTILAIVGISMPVFWVGALMNHYLGFEFTVIQDDFPWIDVIRLDPGITVGSGFPWIDVTHVPFLCSSCGDRPAFPNGGYVPLTENPVDWAHHLILPWTALSLLFIGFYSRVLRSNVLDTINEDYVRTARAKGLSERRVLVKHVLRNSLIPIVTLWGLDFGALLGGGAILTETVFSLQGVGQYFGDSISTLDVPPVLAVTMLVAFTVVVINTLVDIAYAALDPRIRLR